MDEEVGVAEVVAVVAVPSDLAQGRADAVEGVQGTKLSEEAQPCGQKDEIGAGVDDDVGSAFEKEEVDARSEKGVRRRETNRSSTGDDDLEVTRAHRGLVEDGQA